MFRDYCTIVVSVSIEDSSIPVGVSAAPVDTTGVASVVQEELGNISHDTVGTIGIAPYISILPSFVIDGVGIPPISIPAYGAS